MFDNYVQSIDETLKATQSLCLRRKIKYLLKLFLGSSGGAVSSHAQSDVGAQRGTYQILRLLLRNSLNGK